MHGTAQIEKCVFKIFHGPNYSNLFCSVFAILYRRSSYLFYIDIRHSIIDECFSTHKKKKKKMIVCFSCFILYCFANNYIIVKYTFYSAGYLLCFHRECEIFSVFCLSVSHAIQYITRNRIKI